MERKLYPKDQVIELIERGDFLVLSADESVLNQLPKGNWIGGTTPYFMNKDGMTLCEERIFVENQTPFATAFKINKYTKETINQITTDSFDNGFSIVIIPANSEAHFEYSLNALNIPNIAINPIIGYVSGTRLDGDETGKKSAKAFLGPLNETISEGVVVLHAKLPDNKIARAEIINIFEEDQDSISLTFPTSCFTQTECFVNGERKGFADYLTSIDYDIRFPIMENQSGAIINKCFQGINEETKEVSFYAPVFEGVEYKFSKKLNSYKEAFDNSLKSIPTTNFSCNCILNYLYGDIHKGIDITGAHTFGEIAHQLLNQTVVYLAIDEY